MCDKSAGHWLTVCHNHGWTRACVICIQLSTPLDEQDHSMINYKIVMFGAIHVQSNKERGPPSSSFFCSKDPKHPTSNFGFFQVQRCSGDEGLRGFEAVLQIIVSDEIEAHMLYDSVVPSEESFFLEDGIIFYVGTQDSKEF